MARRAVQRRGGGHGGIGHARIMPRGIAGKQLAAAMAEARPLHSFARGLAGHAAPAASGAGGGAA
jgi:hypothetical protein